MRQVERRLSPDHRAIATSIVDAVDDTGYLTIQIEDIVDSIGDDEIGLEEVERSSESSVLIRLVSQRDLRDCLPSSCCNLLRDAVAGRGAADYQ